MRHLVGFTACPALLVGCCSTWQHTCQLEQAVKETANVYNCHPSLFLLRVWASLPAGGVKREPGWEHSSFANIFRYVTVVNTYCASELSSLLSNAIKSLFTFTIQMLSAKCVRLCFETLTSDLRPSEHQTVRPSDHQTIRTSDRQTIRSSDHQNIRSSEHQIIRLSASWLASSLHQ